MKKMHVKKMHKRNLRKGKIMFSLYCRIGCTNLKKNMGRRVKGCIAYLQYCISGKHLNSITVLITSNVLLLNG